MKNNEDMNVKIQDAAIGGQKNSGSCAGLATYLEHEDEDREKAGKEPFPFSTAEGIPVTKEEVINKIDRDHHHLSAKDVKFYHLIVSPSQDEILAMGHDEKEVYHSACMLLKEISDAYAKNFHREGIEDSSDIEIFWKPHFTRGKDDNLQFHLHAIIRRKSRSVDGKNVKLSPTTNHRNTENGPVKGGFDRKTFYNECEGIFDRLMNYDRKVAETFEYNNANVHGTVEEKAAQAKLLAQEKMSADADAIVAGLARHKKAKKDATDLAELEQTLGPGGVKAEIDKAVIISNVASIFAQATSKLDLNLKLMTAGYIVNERNANDGGVEDIVITSKGTSVSAAQTLAEQDYQQLLLNWEAVTGNKPAFLIAEERKKARKVNADHEAAENVFQVDPPKKKVGHRF